MYFAEYKNTIPRVSIFEELETGELEKMTLENKMWLLCIKHN